jgi:hypothetical protein
MWLSLRSAWESSPLVGLIGAAAGVLAVLTTIWGAFYASRPRRALTYSARMQLLKGAKDNNWADSCLQGADRQHAAKVDFILRGSGRLDVPTTAFDKDKPITVDVAKIPIRSAVGFAYLKGGGFSPEYKPKHEDYESGCEYRTLTIEPGLIGRNQILCYTWITVSNRSIHWWRREAHVTLKSPLVDTKLRPSRRNIGITLGIFAGATALIFGLFYGSLSVASYISSGQAHASLHKLLVPLQLIALLPLLIGIIQLGLRGRNSRQAERAAAKDVPAVDPGRGPDEEQRESRTLS